MGFEVVGAADVDSGARPRRAERKALHRQLAVDPLMKLYRILTGHD
jgi:hypothetical protein